uniref:Uncharacterized protein n=1 Tax=Ditylenchus dipsaci TaxID=166011 RepID=A0A915DF43_9BILA
MEEFRSFNLDKLYEGLSWDDNTFLEWLQNLGLIHSARTCLCGGKMNLRNPKWEYNTVCGNALSKSAEKKSDFWLGLSSKART